MRKTKNYFLLTGLTGVFILAFFILRPFLTPLILAIVFATVFAPVNKKILDFTTGRKGIAAALSTLAVFIIIVIPISFLVYQIFQEATGLYTYLTEKNGNEAISTVQETINRLKNTLPPPMRRFSVDYNQYLKQGLNTLLQRLGPVFADAAKLLLSFFVFLIALYYLFKDGRKFKKSLIELSPMQQVYNETIFIKLEAAINSVIKGYMAVAFIQGMLTATGFAIFGIPNPVLFGSIATIAALIPAIGTSLVLIPAIAYLFFSGETGAALGLLAWGMTAVGLIDNLLAPKLVERGIQLHPFLILISILGGMAFFWPVGFLLGPLVLSLLFALLDIYLIVRKEHTEVTRIE